MKKFYLASMMVLALFLVMSLKSFSQQPPYTPLNFMAVQVETDKGNKIKLSWNKNPEGPAVEFFRIFRAEGQTDDLSRFKKIADVKAEESISEYDYTDYPGANGKYTYYIVAVNIFNEELYFSERTDFKFINFIGSYVIKIVSKPKETATVGKEYVYEIVAETNLTDNCPLRYELYGDYPDGMTINKQTGRLSWIPKKDGRYTIKVKVYADCDKNVEPAYQQFTIVVGTGVSGKIKFVTEPNTKGEIGVQWSYKFKAESDVDCPIIYVVNAEIDGLNWDKETNTLTFTPQKSGYYIFRIKAYLKCDESVYAVQEFKVTVGNVDGYCAKIVGTVKDAEGESIASGTVRAWLITDNNKETPVYKTSIERGFFTLKLNEGKYIIDVDGELFYHEWYEDADEMADAKRIDVKCKDELEIHIVVERKPEPKYYVVSGKVLSESDNEPVYSKVEFIIVELFKNEGKYESFVTKTRDNGEYEIKLPDKWTYKVRAVPLVDGFAEQYYDGVTSIYEADMIELTQNVDGINFKLKKLNSYSNGLTGKMVADATGNFIRGLVTAYLVSASDGNEYKFSKVAETDAEGKFKFTNLIPGDYVLMSVPFSNSYVPGYYKQNSVAALKWREATKITVGNSMLDEVFTIRHKLRNGYKGIIRVKGNVIDITSNFGKGSDNSQGSKPVAGAYVYVIDENGNISDFTFSSTTGSYEMVQLGSGKYTVYVDKVGYGSYSKQINTDYSQNYDLTVDLPIILEEPASVDDNQILSGMNVYPSPASDFINLELIGESGMLNIGIFDLTGNEIMTESLAISQGANIIKIPVNNLSAGIYLINVRDGKQFRASKFSVIR
ncbi:MAG: carboxypeptidase regulatory-like domain-containing protein [Candidatus Kapabacteria bacterium]|nr:carboxypeptidase regulatory-like domain-containing protein [Candidatus Kapabacteria bacterium]